MRLPSWLVVIVAAAPLAAQETESLVPRVNRALTRGREELAALAERSHGGELALICLALLDDAAADDPDLRGAIERLARTDLSGSYELALRLMVMVHDPDYPDRSDAAARDAKKLVGNQVGSGGFGYGRGRGASWDLSNTQYGALGLRAAAALGIRIAPRRWRMLAKAAGRAQARDGGFAYRAGKGSSYISMTAAGIAVLEICRQRLSAKDAARVSKKIARGWQWMDEHKSQIGQVGTGHTYYFLYGLERAAILSGRTKVGGDDWYGVGAEALLDCELQDGGWARYRRNQGRAIPADAVATSFAVLFLRREFKKTLAAVTLGGGYLCHGLPIDASETQIDHAVELDVARGPKAVPDLIKSLRSPLLPRRQAAARALRQITGREFGYSAEASPEATAAVVTAVERWWLTEGRRAVDRTGG